ncbi:MAG: ribonuclease R [Phycisphaerales bacterium]|nr:ribonuclease R [Phycisphaerales bacterium]
MSQDQLNEPAIRQRIIRHVSAERYRPQKPRQLARALHMAQEPEYRLFRRILRELLDKKLLTKGPRGTVVAPSAPTTAPAPAGSGETAAIQEQAADQARSSAAPRSVSAGPNQIVGTYRQNKRGFGFVTPTDPPNHEDLYIGQDQNGTAISGDIVKAMITSRHRRGSEIMYEGRIIEIVQRARTHFVGSLEKIHGGWVVLPDGNDFIDPILVPDAGSHYLKGGTKVAVEITQYPEHGQPATGVISQVLGQQGQKDVDLQGVLIQYNLPTEFPPACQKQAKSALQRFNDTLEQERQRRRDLSDEIIVTIDPDDARDYDDAISVRRLENGHWQLGVHIADVAFFVDPQSPLDEEAAARGNSTYLPGYVVPMLPEILSNGVCSLQEGVPRLCKSVFVELDDQARPVKADFADSIIRSRCRLRYREAQAMIDKQPSIPHPEGQRTINDYPVEVVQLLNDMEVLARKIQARRHAAGQLVLTLPQVELKLDEQGAVIGAEPEDTSYTHTIIEMFMVEANEAVARLLDGLNLPFIRRIHPEPAMDMRERLRNFVHVAGYKLPEKINRKALQTLLETVADQPGAFAVNMAVLRSLSRAVYSVDPIGHYALASEFYGHFTSPIRRYADLTVHRLLGSYIQMQARLDDRRKLVEALQQANPSAQQLKEISKHISFTERRSADAEDELRTVKLLELLSQRKGEEFEAVVTGITRFGIFLQLKDYLIDGLIRYEDLNGERWDVDEKRGVAHGRTTGQRIAIGDLATVIVARVNVPRRELDVSLRKMHKKTAASGQEKKSPTTRKSAPMEESSAPAKFKSRRSIKKVSQHADADPKQSARQAHQPAKAGKKKITSRRKPPMPKRGKRTR